jgi:Mrp family chromosome partitioning ATPase
MVPMQDGRLIADRVDGLVLVISAHRTPRQLLEETLDAVEPAKMLGIVFNRNDRPRARYGTYDAYGSHANGDQNGVGPGGENGATSSRMHRAIERVRRGFRE